MTSPRRASMQEIEYPAIGRPAEPRPVLPGSVYVARLAAVRRAMQQRGLDALVLYADREHTANVHWLTNYDPRFEETLLVVRPEGVPVLFVGNEGMGYSNVALLDVTRRLYQPFSLLGQPRDQVRPLATLLGDAGLKSCRRLGVAGWKYFSAAEFEHPESVLDVPEFIALAIRAATPDGAAVTNETAIFFGPEGLRAYLEPEQIADFEWVATHNAENVRAGMAAVTPGKTEHEVFAAIPYHGIPFSCYSACATGPNVLRCGFPSPTSRRIESGDPIFISYSYQGANCCRFGWVAQGPGELPDNLRDYAERAAVPYFQGLAAWYEALRIGVTGHALHHAVTDLLKPKGFRFALNIGHQIASDEWTNSFIADGSRVAVQSGMYIQADFFGNLDLPHYGAFAEDGVVMANAGLRSELARRFPDMWKRMTRRREFMTGVLGIPLDADTLPVSNLAGAVIPYFLHPTLVPCFT